MKKSKDFTEIELLFKKLQKNIINPFPTKYNFFQTDKIQAKIIDYELLKERLPLILFNVSILILFNFIGIKYFHHILCKF